jgi:hypothetical protein
MTILQRADHRDDQALNVCCTANKERLRRHQDSDHPADNLGAYRLIIQARTRNSTASRGRRRGLNAVTGKIDGQRANVPRH